MEHYREEKRQRQIKNAGKRKRQEDEQGEGDEEREGQTRLELGSELERMAMEAEMGATTGTTETATGIERGTEKRARVDADVSVSLSPHAREESDGMEEGSRREIVRPLAPPEGDGATTMVGGAVAGPSQVHVPEKVNCSKVCPEVRGHTSYLTFARLVPFTPSDSTDTNPTPAS